MHRDSNRDMTIRELIESTRTHRARACAPPFSHFRYNPKTSHYQSAQTSYNPVCSGQLAGADLPIETDSFLQRVAFT